MQFITIIYKIDVTLNSHKKTGEEHFDVTSKEIMYVKVAHRTNRYSHIGCTLVG